MYCNETKPATEVTGQPRLMRLHNIINYDYAASYNYYTDYQITIVTSVVSELPYVNWHAGYLSPECSLL